MSHVTVDYPSIMKYTTRLLRKLFIYLPRDEQIRLSASLPRVVASGKKQGLDMEFKYWGLNIVQGIQVCRYVVFSLSSSLLLEYILT